MHYVPVYRTMFNPSILGNVRYNLNLPHDAHWHCAWDLRPRACATLVAFFHRLPSASWCREKLHKYNQCSLMIIKGRSIRIVNGGGSGTGALAPLRSEVIDVIEATITFWDSGHCLVRRYSPMGPEYYWNSRNDPVIILRSVVRFCQHIAVVFLVRRTSARV